MSHSYFLVLIVLAAITGCASGAKEYLQNGLTFYNQKQYQGALEQFDRAAKLEPGMADVYYHRGNLYRDWNKQYDLATENYSKALEIKPDYVVALMNRGNIYRLQSKPKEATKDYEKILQLDANNARAHYNLSLIYKDFYTKNNEFKELNQAKIYINKALEYDPENPDFYRTRADMFILEKEYTKAVDDYSKILQLDQQDLRAMMERGIAFYHMKDYNRAYRDFNECQDKGFQHPQIDVYRRKVLENKTNK